MITCMYPGCQNVVTGRRQKRYCSNAHKQAHYRMTLKAKTDETPAGVNSEELESALQRIDELEAEVKQLRAKLDIERRYRQDHQRRGFKAWLKKQAVTSIGDLGKRIQNDAYLPAIGSRATYEANLRSHNYSQDDLREFAELWKLMLLQ